VTWRYADQQCRSAAARAAKIFRTEVTAIVVGDTEASLRFCRDTLGMQAAVPDSRNLGSLYP
jgi:hypothetical protein